MYESALKFHSKPTGNTNNYENQIFFNLYNVHKNAFTSVQLLSKMPKSVQINY